MRRGLVLAAVLVVGALAWVLLDADPDGRQELVDRLANAFGADTEEAPPPNWGDVATKVGEFTEADRELREVLNPALEGGAGAEAAGPEESVPSIGAAVE